MASQPLSGDETGITLALRVKPRAGKSRVLGVRGDVVEVAVAGAPVDGAANEELVRTLSDFFDVGVRAVRIVSGATSRNKRVRVDGVRLADAEARLARIG
ncbi:MAG: DUF167 domain-containing protein [Pseudomonadota bacterium]|nr:MAG: hypothetical protein DIU78_22565 [Pseudomonadota bacterium]